MTHLYSPVETSKELSAWYRSIGAETEESLSTIVQSVAGRSPWSPAVSEADLTLDYGELFRLVGSAATWLRQVGVVAGDVVTWQAPNWIETYILSLAIWYVGAISNPIVTIYREHELRIILEQVRPDVVIAPKSYRGCEHVELFESVLSELDIRPKAKVVLRGSVGGWTNYEQVIAASPSAPTVLGPDDPALLLFTSGTTSAPKGAVHTSRTLVSPCVQINRQWGWTSDDAAYMPAPLAHVTGMMIGITSPILAGAHTVLSDRWDPESAARDLLKYDIKMMSGATVFLDELTEELTSMGATVSMKAFSCGGANTTAATIEKAAERGINAWRCYGLTEVPCATVMSKNQPIKWRAESDGRPSPGVEIVAIGDDDQPLAADLEGELLARGPQRMRGYLDPAQNVGVIDEHGWVHTGDLGRVSEEGLVTVTGRIKDIINRGGEKISASELEELVGTHPDVRRVAIVAGPHERLGEVPVAFVVLRPGSGPPSSADFTAFLSGKHLPMQKLPTAWHFIDEIPTTPTGKIKKFELIERLGK